MTIYSLIDLYAVDASSYYDGPSRSSLVAMYLTPQERDRAHDHIRSLIESAAYEELWALMPDSNDIHGLPYWCECNTERSPTTLHNRSTRIVTRDYEVHDPASFDIHEPAFLVSFSGSHPNLVTNHPREVVSWASMNHTRGHMARGTFIASWQPPHIPTKTSFFPVHDDSA
jgi:hypothetical protein